MAWGWVSRKAICLSSCRWKCASHSLYETALIQRLSAESPRVAIKGHGLSSEAIASSVPCMASMGCASVLSICRISNRYKWLSYITWKSPVLREIERKKGRSLRSRRRFETRRCVVPPSIVRCISIPAPCAESDRWTGVIHTLILQLVIQDLWSSRHIQKVLADSLPPCLSGPIQPRHRNRLPRRKDKNGRTAEKNQIVYNYCLHQARLACCTVSFDRRYRFLQSTL